MKTELEIKMETCPHKLTYLGLLDGWYCTLCGCTIQGNKIIPATSWSKDSMHEKKCGACDEVLENGKCPLKCNACTGGRNFICVAHGICPPDRHGCKPLGSVPMSLDNVKITESLYAIGEKINEIIRKLNSL